MSEGAVAHVSILGGGLTGLSAGYYLRQSGIPFTIYEQKDRIGGNCVTFRYGDFCVDSGPHRFHDKDSSITATLRNLLGDDLVQVDAPSQVYRDGRFVDFPLVPLDLVKYLGIRRTARAACEIIRNRWRKVERPADLSTFASSAYGSTIAQQFLIEYSEKLWDTPAEILSSVMARKRLQGLGIGTLLRSTFSIVRAECSHLDGRFLYPREGIGAIPESLAQACRLENIKTGARVTKLIRDGRRIGSIVINGQDTVEVGEVLSTLPLTLLLSAMDPPPEPAILDLTRRLRYRGLILVALFLKKDLVTPNATVYFPENRFVFTRLYEPKNRSAHMAPRGRTSLVAEIPCDHGDCRWKMSDEEIMELVASQLAEIGWLENEDLLAYGVWKMDHAYPVIEVGTDGILNTVFAFLETFDNIRVSGRNGLFAYKSIHDLVRLGKETVRTYAA